MRSMTQAGAYVRDLEIDTLARYECWVCSVAAART